MGKPRSKPSAFEVPHPRDELDLKEDEETIMKLVKERAQDIGRIWHARMEKDGEKQTGALTQKLRKSIFKSVTLHAPPMLYWMYHRFSTRTSTKYRHIYAPYAFDSRNRVRVEFNWVKKKPKFDISLPWENWPQDFLQTLRQLPAPETIEVDEEAAEAPLLPPAIEDQGPCTRNRAQKGLSTNVQEPPRHTLDDADADSGSEVDEDESGDYTPEGQAGPKGVEKDGGEGGPVNGKQKKKAMAKGRSQSPRNCKAEPGNEVVRGPTPNESQDSRPTGTPLLQSVVPETLAAELPTPEHSPRQPLKESCSDQIEFDEETKAEKEWWARLAIAIITQGRRIGCLEAARLKERETLKNDIFEHIKRLPFLPDYARCHKVESIRARHGDNLEENVKLGKWWQDVADVLTGAAVLLQVDPRPRSNDNEQGKLCDELAKTIYGYARLIAPASDLHVKKDRAQPDTPSSSASSGEALLTPEPTQGSVSKLQKRSRPPTPSSGPGRPTKRERRTQTCSVVIPRTNYASLARTPSTQPRNGAALTQDANNANTYSDATNAVITPDVHFPQHRAHGERAIASSPPMHTLHISSMAEPEMEPWEVSRSAGERPPSNNQQPTSSTGEGTATSAMVSLDGGRKKGRKQVRNQAWVENGKPGAKHQMKQKRKRGSPAGPPAFDTTRLQAGNMTSTKGKLPPHKAAAKKTNPNNNHPSRNPHLHYADGRGNPQAIQAWQEEPARQTMHAHQSSTGNQVNQANRMHGAGMAGRKKRPRRKPKKAINANGEWKQADNVNGQ